MLSSMGTMSMFMHPVDALHGDLGIVSPEDTIIFVSYSGESPELVALLDIDKVKLCGLIAMCGQERSTLVRSCHAWLDCTLPVDEQIHPEAWEAIPAPTCSSTATLALGDAFAVALTSARGICRDEFAKNHPGGAIGAQLKK